MYIVVFRKILKISHFIILVIIIIHQLINNFKKYIEYTTSIIFIAKKYIYILKGKYLHNYTSIVY